MSVLDPLSRALAAVVAAAHDTLTTLGADPGSGTTWLLSIAAIVVLVRLALLPLAVHAVRQAHAAARARPRLTELGKRYASRKDPDSMRAYARERREIGAEHGVSRLGCLPLLAQLPVWFALYHLLADVASGASVGSMTPDLVTSLGAATVAGVPLAARGYLGAGPGHLLVVAGLALTAAGLSYVTQRFLVLPNSVATDLPDAVASAQQLLPLLAAGGMLLAAGVVPVALLGYWVCNSLWTAGQSAVVWRFFPTPGSPAAQRWAAP